MPATWPASLPQAPATFNEQPKSIVVRTQPDTGPTKSRRRYTKAARQATMTFLMTIDQYKVLDDFFENDLQGGAVSVNFMHPWRQVMKEMYITDPPSFQNDEGLGVNVSVKVEYF